MRIYQMLDFCEIRQFINWPHEFRIQALALPNGIADALEKLAKNLVTTRHQVDDAKNQRGNAIAINVPAFAEACTALWRLRARMLKAGSQEPIEEMLRPYRQLESVFDALARAKVDIQSHTNEFMPAGGEFALKTLAFQPMSGLIREQVIETVKPSIYLEGKLIQMGEVIVGTPSP